MTKASCEPNDVERFFPKARYVEHWFYYGGLGEGKAIISFNTAGLAERVWHDW